MNMGLVNMALYTITTFGGLRELITKRLSGLECPLFPP